MKLSASTVDGVQSRKAFSGVTVLELTMVLAILTATTGLLVHNLAPENMRFAGGGGNQTPAQIVTMSTVKNLRESLVGDGTHSGYWDDMAHNPSYFPAKDRFRYLFEVPDNIPNEYTALKKYNPAIKLGWRGPYFQGTGATYPLVDTGKGFTSAYLPTGGTKTYPVLLDGWGNPLVVQGPFASAVWSTAEVKRTRIVSAGPNGKLETSTLPAYYDSPAVSDDIIVYIFATE